MVSMIQYFYIMVFDFSVKFVKLCVNKYNSQYWYLLFFPFIELHPFDIIIKTRFSLNVGIL